MTNASKPDKPKPTSGLCVIDKPAGMTSHDVVSRVRRIAGTRKVGHAGTLDPMATGVLVVGVERATRLLGYISGTTKSYEAVIRLGQSTITDDAEGEITATVSAADLDPAAVVRVMEQFVGEIDQVPAAVSAVKQDGKRAYARVRAGEKVELPSRRVTVSRFSAEGFTAAETATGDAVLDVTVTVECSSGTYIRSLARDVGAELGVGGHLTVLRRTRVGGFDLSRATTLEELAELEDPVAVELSDAVAAQFPRRDIDAAQAAKLRNGVMPIAAGTPGPYGAFDPSGVVVALLSEVGKKVNSHIVFPAD